MTGTNQAISNSAAVQLKKLANTAFLANPVNCFGLKKASELAGQGKVVVGGMAEPSGHGHVIIVLPGRWKPADGYMADGRLMPFVGLFPPAMSTALAPPGHKPWPAAVSDGDKTAYDP
jgi:hypothetical protein